jgi:ABC-2 type transport system ATP-binding protein
MKVLTTLATPDAGWAKVGGFDVVRSPESVRRVIGYVAQAPMIDIDSTGRENLALQGRLYGLRGQTLTRRVDELLHQFLLSEAANRLSRGYSGGMKRKLSIAMGLIHHPEILLLDEPTNGLDPEARTEVWCELERLAGNGLSVLLATHDLEEAERLASKIAIIDQGRVVAEGTVDGLKAEVSGDSVEIEIRDHLPSERVERALRAMVGQELIRCADGCVTVRVANGASAVPLMVTALEGSGIQVVSIRVSRPTLHDVYMHHAGRTFQEAEKGRK